MPTSILGLELKCSATCNSYNLATSIPKTSKTISNLQSWHCNWMRQHTIVIFSLCQKPTNPCEPTSWKQCLNPCSLIEPPVIATTLDNFNPRHLMETSPQPLQPQSSSPGRLSTLASSWSVAAGARFSSCRTVLDFGKFGHPTGNA